jgi:hypothetical protein
MTVISPVDVVVQHPVHPSPGAHLVLARAGKPIAPENLRHPAVVEALAAQAPENESPLADVEGGAYDGMSVKELKKACDERDLDPASDRKSDLIDALESADAD